MELWHSWVRYLVTSERTVPNKGSQNKPIQINLQFRKADQFPFSNTMHKRFDDHHRNLSLKSKHFDLYQRLATKAVMPTSSHTQRPWGIKQKPLRNLILKSKSKSSFEIKRLLFYINGKLPKRTCLTTEITAIFQALGASS